MDNIWKFKSIVVLFPTSQLKALASCTLKLRKVNWTFHRKNEIVKNLNYKCFGLTQPLITIKRRDKIAYDCIILKTRSIFRVLRSPLLRMCENKIVSQHLSRGFSSCLQYSPPDWISDDVLYFFPPSPPLFPKKLYRIEGKAFIGVLKFDSATFFWSFALPSLLLSDLC